MEKQSKVEDFIILFLEFYTTLPHLWNGSATFTNTLKRHKHVRDLVLEAQNRTWSENWETSDLLRPTQSGKKWSFDWNVAMLAQSSYLLHWLQYWCLEQEQYHVPHFEEDMLGFILHIAHPQRPFSTQQQREKKILHNLFLSLTKNHLVLVNRSKSRDDKMSSKSRHLTFLSCNSWVHLARYCHSCDTVHWVRTEPRAPAPLHLDQSILNTVSILIWDDF